MVVSNLSYSTLSLSNPILNSEPTKLKLFSGKSKVMIICSSVFSISKSTSNEVLLCFDNDNLASGEAWADCAAECERFTSPMNEILYSKVCIVSITLKVNDVDAPLFVCVFQLEVVVPSYSDLGTILIISDNQPLKGVSPPVRKANPI